MTVRFSNAGSFSGADNFSGAGSSEPPLPPAEAVPTSRRERRAAGKKAQVPPRAFSAPVATQRQYAVRRRG